MDSLLFCVTNAIIKLLFIYNFMNISKSVFTLVAIMALALFAPVHVFAAKGDATITVVVKDSTQDNAKTVSNVYVAMYNAKVVDYSWFGDLAQYKKINKGQKSVKFVVKPGQVVDFAVYEIKEDVLNHKKRQFFTPPQKNFFKTDGKAQLCVVAGVDFNNKLEADGKNFCGVKNSYVYAGANVTVTVEVKDSSEDDAKLVSDVYVGMFTAKVVDSMWLGDLFQYKKINKGQKNVKFAINPGQVVDFVVFETKQDMLDAAKDYEFTTPPQKNFSAEDGIKGQVCMVAGIDYDNKLTADGKQFCGKEFSLVLE